MEKEYRVCQNCNTKLTKNDVFCPNCGKLVKNIDRQVEPEEEKEERVIKKSEPERVYTEAVYRKNDRNESTRSNSGSFGKILLTILLTALICFGIFYAFWNYYLKGQVEETVNKKQSPINSVEYSNVTITDTGIADSVAKVYDSVVVVKAYVNNRLSATGSGFVYKTDGDKAYILTNAHVISGTNSVKVVFTNNDEEDVEVVGSDTYSDIAVLKVAKSKILTTSAIGSSEELRLGDTAFTVGTPVDSDVYAWTVTRGIISGKNRLVIARSTNSAETYVAEVLQTDAAINSGNSGGPLCNANGEVVGITNMKLASSEIEGMGFAIPIETATKYADRIISGKSIERPYLGISMYDGSSYSGYSSFFGNITNIEGVYINSVSSGSPAEKAGLKKDDKILAINDKEVTSVDLFKFELYKYNIGDTITIKIERDGKKQDIQITLTSNTEKEA